MSGLLRLKCSKLNQDLDHAMVEIVLESSQARNIDYVELN